MGLYLCILGFVISIYATSKSLVNGLCSVLAIGYLYGITRANYPDTFSHFIFDSTVVGFYLGLLQHPPSPHVVQKGLPVQKWVTILIGWALVMFFLPFQHPLIQLVGLRGNAFLVPFLLVGAWLILQRADNCHSVAAKPAAATS